MDAFAELIDEGMKRKGWGYNRLSVEIGVLPGGGIFNPTQIRRLRFGERRSLNRELIERLIAVLGLDRADAWEAALESADLKPPGLTADHLRKLDLVATNSSRVSPDKLAPVLALHGERRQRDRRRSRRLEVAA